MFCELLLAYKVAIGLINITLASFVVNGSRRYTGIQQLSVYMYMRDSMIYCMHTIIPKVVKQVCAYMDLLVRQFFKMEA